MESVRRVQDLAVYVVACGIDPVQSTLFEQSTVPESMGIAPPPVEAA